MRHTPLTFLIAITALLNGCTTPKPIPHAPQTSPLTNPSPNLHLTKNGIVLFDISPEAMDKIAASNFLQPLPRWPILRFTSFPVMMMPELIREKNPSAEDMGNYQAAPWVDGQRIYYLLYSQKDQILVIVEWRH